MTRKQKTAEWLKGIFLKLIEYQQTGGLVINDFGGISFEFTMEDDGRITYWPTIACCGPLCIADLNNPHTKKYWRERFKSWRLVAAKNLKKINCK